MTTQTRGGSNRKHFNQSFFNRWSPKMAYVLGYIFADGAVENCRTSSRTCYLSISSKDQDILKQIQKAMSSKHHLYKREAATRVFPGFNKVFTSGPIYLLRIGNLKLYEALIRLGLTPRKSLDMKFPRLPTRFLPYFLRGYFDGDGCINCYLPKNRLKPDVQTIFTSGSWSFLDSLNEILSNRLLVKAQNMYQNERAFRLRYRTRDSKKILDFIYKNLDAAPYLRRKYLKFKAAYQT